MHTQSADGAALPPSVLHPVPKPGPTIGFNIHGEVVGLSALGRLVLEPLRRPTSARAHFVAAGALAAQGVRLAVADMLRPAASPAETAPAPVVLTATASLPPAPAVALIEATPVIEAPAKAKRPRWSAAETAALIELRASGLSYARIAERLGTGRTAAAVGAKARALAAKPTVPPPARETARTRRHTAKGPAAK